MYLKSVVRLDKIISLISSLFVNNLPTTPLERDYVKNTFIMRSDCLIFQDNFFNAILFLSNKILFSFEKNMEPKTTIE